MSSVSESIEVSVIVPVCQRHADIINLYGDYKTGLAQLGLRYELIFVVDGRLEDVSECLDSLQRLGVPLSIVRLTKSFGEAAALMAGFERACGSIIITLPGYFQIKATEIGKLVEALRTSDVAIGRRWPRAGGRLEAFRRNAFHWALKAVTGLNFHDLGCSARAMRRRVVEELHLYGDQHRFLAVLAARQGFHVTEIAVQQSPKDRFEGRYRLREYAHRGLDIITVLFLVRFTKKPLRFFGMIGLALAGLGGLLLLYLIVSRLGFGVPLADRPALLLTSLLVVLGLQLFAIGLLGELVIFTHASDIKDYQVESVTQFPERDTPAVLSSAATDDVRVG
jgi:glycosyltransferase involved in cell wall biosynthesis